MILTYFDNTNKVIIKEIIKLWNGYASIRYELKNKQIIEVFDVKQFLIMDDIK